MFTTTPRVITTAAALVAAGATIAISGPASAAPPLPLAPADCDWIIFDTDSVVKQDNGIQVHIAWAGTDGNGTGSYSSNGFDWEGPVQGGVVKGTNKLDFTIPFALKAVPFGGDPAPAPPTNHYRGTIDSNSNASGTTVNNSGVSNRWTITSGDGFKCIGRQPAPAPANQGANPGTSGPQPVTNAITVSFDGTSNTTFKMTVKNSSPLPASCNYEAVSLNPLVPSDTARTFNVAPNGSDTESFDGLKTGSSYKVTMTCTDSSGTQTEPLGSINQTVKW